VTAVTTQIAVGELPDAPSAADASPRSSAGVTAPGDGVVSVPVGGLHAPTIVEVRAEDLEPGDVLASGARVLEVGSRAGLTVVTVLNSRALVTTNSRITVAPDVLFGVIR
jgi:hypothetical protein